MLGYVVVAFVISQLSDRLGACNILDPAQFHNSAQIRTLKSCSHLLRHLSTVYSRALSNGTRSFALLPWERINTMTCSSYLPKCSLMCPLPSPLQHRFFFAVYECLSVVACSICGCLILWGSAALKTSLSLAVADLAVLSWRFWKRPTEAPDWICFLVSLEKDL